MQTFAGESICASSASGEPDKTVIMTNGNIATCAERRYVYLLNDVGVVDAFDAVAADAVVMNGRHVRSTSDESIFYTVIAFTNIFGDDFRTDYTCNVAICRFF